MIVSEPCFFVPGNRCADGRPESCPGCNGDGTRMVITDSPAIRVDAVLAIIEEYRPTLGDGLTNMLQAAIEEAT